MDKKYKFDLILNINYEFNLNNTYFIVNFLQNTAIN
jgi:hypothetical protein